MKAHGVVCKHGGSGGGGGNGGGGGGGLNEAGAPERQSASRPDRLTRRDGPGNEKRPCPLAERLFWNRTQLNKAAHSFTSSFIHLFT